MTRSGSGGPRLGRTWLVLRAGSARSSRLAGATRRGCLAVANGHEWARRQLAKAGIGFTALGNGFASCEDPVLLQRVCGRLGAGAVTGVLLALAAPPALPVHP